MGTAALGAVPRPNPLAGKDFGSPPSAERIAYPRGAGRAGAPRRQCQCGRAPRPSGSRPLSPRRPAGATRWAKSFRSAGFERRLGNPRGHLLLFRGRRVLSREDITQISPIRTDPRVTARATGRRPRVREVAFFTMLRRIALLVDLGFVLKRSATLTRGDRWSSRTPEARVARPQPHTPTPSGQIADGFAPSGPMSLRRRVSPCSESRPLYGARTAPTASVRFIRAIG